MLKKLWNKIKRRWVPYFIAYTAKIGVRILLKTCKLKIEGLENFTTVAKQSPCILMLWHNRLVIVAEILNKFASQFSYTAFISKSRDGDPLALLAESYKSGRALRVPHNARHRALNEMIQLLKEENEIILITPDGPRGPRYHIKPGIVVAARQANAKIIPFSWKAKHCWQLNTWDKMLIPKPFTTIHVVFANPHTVTSEQNHESEIAKLQEALLKLE